MWEFKFYSRGGQGAVTAAKILINAAIIEGKFGQAIPSYGQERKGAPVYTYARIADDPINVKSYVYRPNCVICFDTSLKDLDIDITEGVRPGSTLVVNTDEVDYVNSSFGMWPRLTPTRSPTRCWVRSPLMSRCWVPWPRPRAVFPWTASCRL